MPRLLDVPAFELAPDWVCEVVSPKTGILDRRRKMPIYGRESVSHLWIVDPILKTLEVYRLETGRWVVASTHAATSWCAPSRSRRSSSISHGGGSSPEAGIVRRQRSVTILIIRGSQYRLSELPPRAPHIAAASTRSVPPLNPARPRRCRSRTGSLSGIVHRPDQLGDRDHAVQVRVARHARADRDSAKGDVDAGDDFIDRDLAVAVAVGVAQRQLGGGVLVAPIEQLVDPSPGRM